MQTLPRRSGIKLDPHRLDHELARRGISARQLAQLAGIPEPTLSRARHGRPISQRSLRLLADALVAMPPLPGADLLIATRREEDSS